ncbi:MAG: cohesin domain-containing protein [Gemmatimonadota bacterium]
MTFKPFRFALLALVLIFSLVRCGADSPTGVVAIALDLSSATLRVGTTVQVNATVTVGGVTSTQTVTFSSDNSAVLSVTPTGLIRALTIGTANLTATASSGETKTALVTVIAGLPFSVQKTAGDGLTAVAGTTTATPPTVVVRDSAGNLLSGVAVTFAVASGGGSVTGASATTNASGVATAGSWTLGPNAGTNTLTATATGVATSAIFSATGTAPVPSTIAINGGNGQTATSGLAVPAAPSVIVRNNLGQPAAGVTVVFSVGAGGGVVTGSTQVTNASGIATVGSWNLGAAGVNTLNATAAGLPAVVFTATATAAPSNTMSANGGNGQSAVTGTAVAIAPSVIVLTSTGQPVPGTQVTFAIASGGGSITGATAITNANGVAAVGSWTLGAVGANTLTASASGLGTVTFTATATAAPTGSLVLSGSSLSFAAVVNGNTPSAQSIQVTNSATGTLSGLATGTISYSGLGTGWLSVSLNGATTPATLTVAIASALPPGTYGASFPVTATGASNNPQTVSVTFVVAPASQIIVTQQPAGASTGNLLTTQPVVRVADGFGGTITAFNGPVTATLVGAGGVLSGTTTVNAVNGIATFTNLVVTGVGTYSLAFSATASTGTSATFAVAPLPPTKLGMGTQPAGAVSNTVFSTQPVVELRDVNGNVVTGATGNVTVAVTGESGPGTLSGTLTVAAVNGVARFTDLKISATGSYTLAFTSGTLTGINSATFSVTASPPTNLGISTQPGGSQTGSVLTTQPVVLVRDFSLATVVGATNAVTATLNGAGGTLSGTTTVNAVNGVATFTDLKITGAGTYTITFNAGPLAPVTSASIIVAALPPTQLTIGTQPVGGGTGLLLPTQPVIQVKDASNGVVNGATNAVTVALVGAGGTLSGTTTVNAVNGIATFTDLKITGVGSYTLSFTSGALTGVTSGTVTISTLPPTKLVVQTQPSASTVSGSVFAAQPVVQVQDQSNGVVAAANNPVTATLSGAGGTLSGTTTVNAVNGIATFTDLKVTGAGTYTIIFSAGALTSATSASITITPLPATQLTMQTQPGGASANAIFTTQPIVQVRDASNSVVAGGSNPVTATLVGTGGTLSGTTTVNAVNGIATFTNLKVSAAGTYSITFSSGSLTSVTSAPFTVTINPAVSIAVNVGASATASAAVGTNITIPVGIDMANGQGQNLASLTFKVTWDPTKFDYVSRTNGTFGTAGSFTVNTANTATGELAVSVFDNDGFSTGAPTILNVTLAPKVAVAGSTVTATVSAAGDVNGVSIPPSAFAVRALSVTTAPAPATKLSIQTQPSGAVSGSTLTNQPVIQIQDASSGVVVAATNSVTATLVGSGGTLSGTTTVAAVNGIATFTDLQVTGAGTYTITFSSGALASATSNSITITPQPATKLAIATQPAGAASGELLSSQPVVQIQDASNGVVTGATNSVTAALGGGSSGTLSGTTTVVAVGGVATFTDLRITGAGNSTIVFTSAALASATSNSISTSALPATKVVITTQPSGASSGSVLATQPVVQLQDASNTVVAGAGNSVTATLNGSGGTLSGTTTVNAVNGTATFTDLKVTGAGSYTITFTSGALTAATSNSITITALPASQLFVAVQPSSGGTSGQPFTTQPVVHIRDAANSLVTTANNNVTATINGSGGLLFGTTTVAAVNGVATFTDLDAMPAGTYTLTFASGGLTSATSASFTVVSGAAHHLAITTQPTGNVSGSNLNTQPVVRVEDITNSPVTSSSVIVTATLDGAGGTLGGTTSVTSVNGVATFTNLKVTGAGNYTITFIASGLTSATSNSINITAQTATQLAITTQPSPNVTGGVAFPTQPVVEIRDGSGNRVAGSTTSVTATVNGPGNLQGTTTVNAVDGVATFTNLNLRPAGTVTLTFSSSGLTPATSNSITTVAGPPAVVHITTQPAGAQSGALLATQPVIDIRDNASSVATTATNAVTATLNGAGGTLSGTTTVNAVNGFATFTDLRVTGAGSYTITFSSSGLTPATSSSFTITAVPATQLAVTTQPAGAASGVAFTTQPVVQVRDASNGLVGTAADAVTATLNGAGGTLTGTTTVNAVNGVATFTNLVITGPGSYTITFSAAGLTPANSASLTVTPGPDNKLAMQTQPVGGATLTTQPVVRVEDANSVLTTSNRSVTATLNGGGGTLGGTATVNAVNGIATFTNLTVTGAGTYTLTFSSSGVTPVISAPFTITGTPASINLNVGASATADATVGTNLVVPIIADMSNAQGQNLASVTFNFTWDPAKFDYVSRTNGTFGGGASYTVNTANAASGQLAVSIFDNDGFSTGSPTILSVTLSPKVAVTGSGITVAVSTAGDVNGTSIPTSKFVIRPLSVTTTGAAAPTPTKLGIQTQPGGAISGSAINPQPVVQVQDASSVTVPGNIAAVTATLNGAGGTLSGTTTVNAVNGVATFSNLVVTGAGSYTITLSSSGLTPVTSNSITITASNTPSQLAISTQPSGAVSGAAFTTQPVVQILNSSNALVTTANNQVTATLNGAGGTLIGTATVTAVNGVATFSGLGITGAGSYTISFSAASLTSATSSSITVTSPPAGATINLNVGANATATATNGTNFSIPITADMSNAQGQNLASMTFQVTWDNTKFDYVSRTNGTFGDGPSYTVNTSQTSSGILTVSVFDNDGFSTGAPVILTVTLLPKASATNTPVGLSVTTAGDVNGSTIPPSKIVVRPLSVTTP